MGALEEKSVDKSKYRIKEKFSEKLKERKVSDVEKQEVLAVLEWMENRIRKQESKKPRLLMERGK